MYPKRKFLLTLCGIFAVSVITVSPTFAGVAESLTNAINTLQSTASSSFKNAELKLSYIHDLGGVGSTIVIAEDETDTASKNQLYQDALNIVNKLIIKTNGCETHGTPDVEDWITNCTDSSSVHTALNQLAIDINTLIQ